jgi:hypothetical protein
MNDRAPTIFSKKKFLGGHTAEMMNIIAELQKDLFTPRFYVAALTDSMSLQKAQVYEQSLIQVVIYHAVLRYA